MLDDKCTLGLLTKLRFYSDLYSKNSILTPTLMLNTWMEEEMLPVFRQAINIPVRSSEAECWHTLLDYVGIKSLIFMCFFVRVNQCNSLCQQTPHVGGQAVPCRDWAGWGSLPALLHGLCPLQEGTFHVCQGYNPCVVIVSWSVVTGIYNTLPQYVIIWLGMYLQRNTFLVFYRRQVTG